MNARAHDKVLRVARTIADLAGEKDTSATHLHEAIPYRRLDQSLWARAAASNPHSTTRCVPNGACIE